MRDIRRAQIISEKVHWQYTAGLNKAKWNEVYNDENEIINDLKGIYVPKENEMPLLGAPLYIGSEYIHSFAKRVQSGRDLTEKQMTQAKRLALEIKKAWSIRGCW